MKKEETGRKSLLGESFDGILSMVERIGESILSKGRVRDYRGVSGIFQRLEDLFRVLIFLLIAFIGVSLIPVAIYLLGSGILSLFN